MNRHASGRTLTTGLLIALLLLFDGSLTAGTEETSVVYPKRPIKLIVPFAAGGGTDTFARIIEKAIEENELLPEPLVIINVGGAGATIGSRRVKNAKPDGYTVLILHAAIMTAKYSGKVNYGPEAFAPVAATGELSMFITVDAQSPYQSLKELMTAARKHPNRLSFGANLGAMTHFAGLQLEKAFPGAKFRFAQIGGGAHRFADLKGGHIDVTGFSIEEFVRFRSEGLRGLAYLGPQRHATAPDVPTAQEQGLEVAYKNTFYWWAPQGTPQKRIDVLADALGKAMRTDYVQKKMTEIHCDPVFLRGEELHRRIRQQSEKFAKVAPHKATDLPNFPAWILAAIACTTGLIALSAWRDRRSSDQSPPSGGPSDRALGSPRQRTDLAVASIVLTIAYVAAMAFQWADFRSATLAFVLLVGSALTRLNLKAVPVLVVMALLLSFGLHGIFTEVLVIDLP